MRSEHAGRVEQLTAEHERGGQESSSERELERAWPSECVRVCERGIEKARQRVCVCEIVSGK